MKINELRALIKEAIAEETSNKFSIKDKLTNILFGKENGVDGYLSQEWRLKRDITPKERSLRIALIIDQLKNYIKSLEEVAKDEETFVQATTAINEIFITLPGLDNEKATQSYRDTEDAYKAGYLEGYNHAINFSNTSTNEGFFGPSEKDIANFEAELNDFIKTNNIKEKIAAKKLPDSYLEQMKAHVTKIAKTSSFKGGKLGFSNLARPIITYDTQTKTQGKG